MSTIAVFVALGGTSYAVARNSIGTAQLKSGAVTSAKIRNGSVAERDLARSARRAGPRGRRGPGGPIGPVGPPGAPGPAAAEGWKPLPFANGWGNYGGHFEVGSYRRDQLGVVHMRGLLTRVSGAPGGVIATLPVGYRPQRTRVFPVHTGENPHQVGRVDVSADGSMVWFSGATGETDYTSLDGIRFEVG
jgi:hypothetical protein